MVHEYVALQEEAMPDLTLRQRRIISEFRRNHGDCMYHNSTVIPRPTICQCVLLCIRPCLKTI